MVFRTVSQEMAVILALWFFAFLMAVLSKDFHFCLQCGCTTIAVGFAPTVLNLVWLIRFTSMFIPVMNSNVGTWGNMGFSFFLSEKEESLGREKTNGCRKK